MSEMFDLWIKGLTPSTGEVYGRYVKRLLKLGNLTPEQAVERTKKDVQTYISLKNLANNFTERGRHIAVFALRSFLYENGVVMLPPARIPTPTPKREGTNLSWDQAHAIILAASKPYNIAFNLMLNCGWGLGEFLKFNTESTWQNIKASLAKEPKAEYYRHEFTSRKKNRRKFYSLIPASLLRETIALTPVPIRASHGYIFEGERRTHKTKGIFLNADKYHSGRIYLEKAWITARKRAAISVEGIPTVHELRDCFRTRATLVGCAPEAAEFAMGHTIDRLGYDKCFYNEPWMWQNLRKIYGPAAATESALQERDKIIEAMQQQIKTLEGQFETIMKARITKET